MVAGASVEGEFGGEKGAEEEEEEEERQEAVDEEVDREGGARSLAEATDGGVRKICLAIISSGHGLSRAMCPVPCTPATVSPGRAPPLGVAALDEWGVVGARVGALSVGAPRVGAPRVVRTVVSPVGVAGGGGKANGWPLAPGPMAADLGDTDAAQARGWFGCGGAMVWGLGHAGGAEAAAFAATALACLVFVLVLVSNLTVWMGGKCGTQTSKQNARSLC